MNSSNSRAKLLIIGCGDIGQRLARHMAPLGYSITGLRRRATADLDYLQYRQCDVTRPEELQPILAEGADVIVISMTPAERSDAGYQQAYVQSCQQLVASLRELGITPRLILFVSSTAVYGQNDGSWVDETSPTLPEGFSGRRLLEAEQTLLNSGYHCSVVRFSGIYGPGRNRLIEQVINRRASASPHFTNRIHAEDCAAALAHLIELDKKQPLDAVYLATDSSPTPMMEVVGWIAQQLNISDFLAADAVNERGNKRISNQRLLSTGYTLRYPDFRLGYRELLRDYLSLPN
ncbi:SDR family oxidoreductase [Cellvibrio fontiphilus]|uniref:SDR family oxidoreductase n=1 Tax=Cellvibrio fontiphilus TaxID=1815559 RepID=A0ABV7FEA1_9GAMM